MKPIPIRDKAQLQSIAAFMKANAEEDSRPKDYPSVRYADVDTPKAVNDTLSDEERERLLNYKGGAVIIYSMRLLSLQITRDDMHGHQWHLSLTEVVGPARLAVPPDNVILFILDAFFTKTQAVPNPGKIKEIIHFVGND